MGSEQLDLFGGAMPSRGRTRGQPVPAPPGEAQLDLSRRLPAEARFGTSSWSFPGWKGIVYDAEYSTEKLARQGLSSYAQHPLLRTVGIDRTYYAPIRSAAFADYAAAVPDDFRFLVKAHEVCTTARFPRHARYGAAAGELNPRFLDAAYATDLVVGPAVEGLGPKAGPLLFQFPPQDVAALGGPEGFAERLDQFLSALPRGPLYAVELRHPSLLTESYRQVLQSSGAVHCLNVHPTMPSPLLQHELVIGAQAPATVIRWMLHGGLRYEQALAQYRPFDRLVAADDGSRDSIASLVVGALREHRQSFVIINNKAEGSAPLSVFRLAAAVARDLEASPLAPPGP